MATTRFPNLQGFKSRVARRLGLKYKKKVEINNPKQVILKNKRSAIQGVCPTCGSKVFRIGKA